MRMCAALLLVLFASLAFAQEIVPQLVTGAVVSLDQSGQVYVNGGTMDELTLNISIPSTTSTQKTIVLQTGNGGKYSPYRSEEGNDYIVVSAKPQSGLFSYEISSEVSTQNSNAGVLPVSYAIPQDVKKYLEADKRIQSNDSRIKALALEITANSTSAFEKVAKLAFWVNNYIKYDETYVGQEKDALTVLQEKRGVCVEYSTLFAALSRSIGIPTRYVGGYAYSNKFNQWLGHVWIEVYIGKWVQVDPTWLQAGYVDALHVSKFRSGMLLGDVKASALVYPQSASIKLTTNDQSGAISSGTKAKSMQTSEPLADFEFFAPSQLMGQNDAGIIVLGINSSDYKIMQAELVGCSGQDVLTLSDGSKNLFLEPNVQTYAVWEVKTGAMEKNVIYSCPVFVFSPYLKQKTIAINMTSGTKSKGALEIKTLKKSISIGESQVVYVQPKIAGDKNVTIVTAHGMLTAPVINGIATFEYAPSELGANKIYAISKNGIGSAYFDVLEKPVTLTFEIEYEKLVYSGNATKITVFVDTGLQKQADVSVNAVLGDVKASAFGVSTGNATLSFFITPNDFGSVPLEIEVRAGNQAQTRTYMISVAKTVVDGNNNAIATVQKNTGQANQQPKDGPASANPQGCATMLISIIVPTLAFACYRGKRK
ncbi:Transglutaminase-like superfamily protein [Candidatus Anstonella stagnisolia]|nr:Transglutaminase-like superfamily protein [Candidatus Anstonella stagnisolia]